LGGGNKNSNVLFSLHEKRTILAFALSPIQELSFLDTVLQPHISNHNHPY
jgi:hypothetical protein